MPRRWYAASYAGVLKRREAKRKVVSGKRAFRVWFTARDAFLLLQVYVYIRREVVGHVCVQSEECVFKFFFGCAFGAVGNVGRRS